MGGERQGERHGALLAFGERPDPLAQVEGEEVCEFERTGQIEIGERAASTFDVLGASHPFVERGPFGHIGDRFEHGRRQRITAEHHLA